MPRTRIIIEGDGPKFSEGMQKCNYCGCIGAAAWIGEEIRSESEGGCERLFPYFSQHPKTGQENGLLFPDKNFTVTIEQDGEEKSTWTVEMGDDFEDDDSLEED